MEKEFSLSEQTIINSFGSAILLGFQWLISVCLVRIKGYEFAGVFSLAMTVANIFSTAASYGLRNYQLTDYQRKNRQNEYLVMRLISCAIATFGCAVYLFWNKSYAAIEKYAIVLYLVYNLAVAISDSMMGSIQLVNHLEINGFSNIYRGMLSFSLFLITLLLNKEFLAALGMMALSSVLVLLLYDLQQYQKYCSSRAGNWYGQLRGSVSLFVEGFPLMLSCIIPMVVTAFPRTAMRAILGTEALGYFSSVYTMAVLLSTVLPPMLIGMVPMISEHWRTGSIRRLIQGVAIEYGIVFTAICLALGTAGLLGKFFLELLYDDSILRYANLLYFSILAVGLSCVCTCGNNIIVAIGGKKTMILFSGLMLAITLCFSNSMIVNHGIYGAAYVQIAAYGGQAIVQIAYLLILFVDRHRNGGY